jgi:signal transduction histidine kinase
MLLTREELQDRLIGLHRASLELVKDVSLETLLERIAALACEQAGARYAALGVLDDEGKLKQFITVGMTAEEIKRIPHPPRGLGLIGALMHTDRNLRLGEIKDDPRSRGFPSGHAEMHSFLGVPIRLGARQLGQIYLTEKVDAPEFTFDDETVIEMLAAYAGAAIENARLHSNARRLAVLEERERIGMDLHDGIIQSIYSVGLTLENARLLLRENPQYAEDRLQKAMDDLNHTVRDIRSYILDLRPRQWVGESLTEGLQQLITEFRQNTKAEVTLGDPKRDHCDDLPPAHAMVLFRICQEALANIAKHANAKKILIDLRCTSDRVLLEVQDDGRGFEVAIVNKTVGHGLANMQTRVANVGGDLNISSVPGEGTTILAWVPRTETQRVA